MRRVLVPQQIDPTPPPLGGVVHSLAGETMGTTWSVRWVGTRASDIESLRATIQQALDRVVAQMSTWTDVSDLARFNRAAPGDWCALPDEFFKVLSAGLQVARASGGAYDPASGALVNLWGFGPSPRYTDADFVLPGADAIAAARTRAGWRELAIDDATRRVLQPGGATLDLSAIAKGFGVDEVVRALQRRGVDSCLVEVGGELRGQGIKPDGQPWWVDLEMPQAGVALTETRVALHGLSVATSGDYRRSFQADGRHFSHTLDPRSGWPVAHGVASVTVLHAECMLADAWSTALTVLGHEEGRRLANRENLAALFVVRTPEGFEEHMSAALAALAQ
jgi:thiamine biosynthesis lipoprotein